VLVDHVRAEFVKEAAKRRDRRPIVKEPECCPSAFSLAHASTKVPVLHGCREESRVRGVLIEPMCGSKGCDGVTTRRQALSVREHDALKPTAPVPEVAKQGDPHPSFSRPRSSRRDAARPRWFFRRWSGRPEHAMTHKLSRRWGQRHDRLAWVDLLRSPRGSRLPTHHHQPWTYTLAATSSKTQSRTESVSCLPAHSPVSRTSGLSEAMRYMTSKAPKSSRALSSGRCRPRVANTPSRQCDARPTAATHERLKFVAFHIQRHTMDRWVLERASMSSIRSISTVSHGCARAVSAS